MKAKVTIQDIADALGISRNTVSKAINNSEGIAEATRDRILQKAVEMGYKHFSYVQALAESQESLSQEPPAPGSEGEIALLTTLQFSDSHFAVTMIDRLRRELTQSGYSLQYYLVGPEELKQKQLPYPLPKENTRAFICFEMFDWPYCDMLCGLDYPLLFVDGPTKSFGRRLEADQLMMDNVTELQRLFTDLIRKGRTRFCFVGNQEHCQSFCERYIALHGALIQSNLPSGNIALLPENHPIEVFHGIANMDTLPDMFVCANDAIAIDVLRILKKLGKSVPEDVLVSGFDDTSESRKVQPSLTTVHIHTQLMAHTAVQMLLTRIKNPDLEYRVTYTQTDLILRDSTRTGDGGDRA